MVGRLVRCADGAGAKVGIDARGLQVHLPDKFPLWRHLRATGNSASVKVTTLMPLIGYLIVFNSHVVDVISLSRHLLGFEQQHGLSTYLLSLYFGLCLVAVASMCPRVIKKCGSAPEFVAAELANSSRFDFDRINGQLNAFRFKKEADKIKTLAENDLKFYQQSPDFRKASEIRRRANKETLAIRYAYSNRRLPIVMVSILYLPWIFVYGPPLS
jgi:hypothetical protein